MILPVQITFRNIESSEDVKGWIQEEANKLDEFHRKITACRVLVELPNRRRKAGNVYHVRVDLTAPGGEIVVKRQPILRELPGRGIRRPVKRIEVHAPHKDLRQAINDAFAAVRRQLQDFVRRQRRDIKTHESPPLARVAKVFSKAGYGFLETPDGREIYFHRNSVLNGAFERLKVGSMVRFVEERGEKGPQASTVKLVRGSPLELGHSIVAA
jgi:cold shock CspA family protein/ribosome-associated translation inhibitor RaiA